MAENKKSLVNSYFNILIGILLMLPISGFCQVNKIKYGAYYFDGWYKESYLITDLLKKSFSERKPIWGWVTSSQMAVNEQIRLASKSGISFFAFCWYNTTRDSSKPSNNALKYYLNSSNRHSLEFCLLVANHKGEEIEKDDWDFVTNEWINLFKVNTYFTIEGMPYISFYSVKSLIEKFGSPSLVKSALNKFRNKVATAGFKGVKISACVVPEKKAIEDAENCGFDILTGYNYHEYGLYKSAQRKVSIDSMRIAEGKVWNKILSITKMNYIPSITLNWDPRPWDNKSNNYSKERYFYGYTPSSVYKSVISHKNWALSQKRKSNSQDAVILYAWNEYGEGAYLTPTKKGVNFLKMLKTAINFYPN